MSNTLFKKFSNFQHTCRRGYPAYILHNAPFKSVTKKENGKTFIPFIGEGYYFWEQDLDNAKRWGEKKYGTTGYSILEVENWDINNEYFIDLINKNHLEFFKKLQKPYIEANEKAKNYSLGVWIELFKKADVFPFKLIRSEEHFSSDKLKREGIDQELIKYSTEGYYTYLNPVYILCCIDKSIIPDRKTVL
ncbi:hypothetical protein [Myroides odoratimimus]|uniref:hypothetical protein n=1 Tax=Myroides odoratimimus TaxID=76832 RepID=UPI002576726B|nr:hypothetical protein [Myroides odoratimimus]MDM1535057.1 hypothetical protein [Myroides odoratimimus]MDM1674185.1 hypothetical protein [Myroides odoratimimus]